MLSSSILPNDPNSNPVSDTYRRFKVLPLPIIEPEHLPISFDKAKANYEARYHKTLKPVFRHKGKDYPVKGTIALTVVVSCLLSNPEVALISINA